MRFARRLILALLAGAAPAAAASAATVIFSTGTLPDGRPLAQGPAPAGPVAVRGGVTQIRQDDGSIVSFVGDARFDASGPALAIDDGRVTVAGGTATAPLSVGGTTLRFAGARQAASFTVSDGALTAGRALLGSVALDGPAGGRSFDAGQAFGANDSGGLRALYTAGAAPFAAPMAGAGDTAPAGGIDIGQNPFLDSLPGGDPAALLGTLIARGRAELSLPAADAALVAYTAILGAGGNPAAASAEAVAATLAAYARFLAAGGSPAAFTGASAALLAAYERSFAALSVGGATPALVAEINARRALEAALGPNANLSAAFAARVLDIYFASLAGGRPNTGGFTLAQLAAYLAYYDRFAAQAAVDQATRTRIADYQRFLAAGGSFGQPAAPVAPVTPAPSALDAARLVAQVVQQRREGRAGTLGGLRSASELSDLVEGFQRNGIPAGLTPEEQERVQTAIAFFTGRGGLFETPGRPFAAVPVTSTLASGPYVRATVAPTESSRLAIAGVESAAVTFNASGVPTAGAYPAAFSFVPMEGRGGPGYLVARFGPTAISTTGYGVALVAPFTGARPTSGTATYALLANTTPQYADGRLVTAATLTGSVRLNFGTALTFATAATIDVTDPLGRRSYSFDTGTGSNAVAATNADLCAAAGSCRINTVNLLGGASGQHVAGSWLITDTTSISSPVLGGAWVFGGTLPAGTSPPPSNPTPTPVGNYSYAAYDGSIARNDASSIAGRSTSVLVEANRIVGTGERGSEFVYDAVLTENRSGPGWLIGRWANGSIRGPGFTRQISTGRAEHYAFTTTRLVIVPVSGTATFGLAAYTTPSFFDGATVTDAAMYGGLAIRFGTTPLYGIEGTITLTANGAAQRYSFASDGGLASPSLAANRPNGLVALDQGVPVVTGDARCGNACLFIPGFALGGSGGDVVAGGWLIGTQAGRNVAAGAAVYLTSAPVTVAPSPGGSSGSGLLLTSYGSPFAGTATNVAVTADGQGRVSNVSFNNGSYDRGTNSDNEFGSVAGIVGWTRWAGGTTAGTTPTTIAANGGGGFLYLAPATALPTSGTATYNMIGATAVIRDGASPAVGSVAGAQLAVNFASRTVGLSAELSVAGSAYILQSAGGLGAPSMALNEATAQFAARGTGAATISGGGCDATCSVRINGALAGPGASHAGLSFVANAAAGSSDSVNGVIAFAR